jgi:hypothetical protein
LRSAMRGSCEGSSTSWPALRANAPSESAPAELKHRYLGIHGELPLPLWERVGVRGSGLSIERNPSPELLRNSTSPTRGEVRPSASIQFFKQPTTLIASLRGANGSGLSAGPMTGSATKQSSFLLGGIIRLDCFASLAMTNTRPHSRGARRPSCA